MGDRNITLFALHTHGDSQFGPSSVPGVGSEDTSASEATSKAKSLFSKGGEDESDDEETDVAVSGSDEESGGGSLGTLAMAIVLLAGIAMVAKKLGGKNSEVDLAESDEL